MLTKLIFILFLFFKFSEVILKEAQYPQEFLDVMPCYLYNLNIKYYWIKHINLAFSQYFSFYRNGLSEKPWLDSKRQLFNYMIQDYFYIFLYSFARATAVSDMLILQHLIILVN